MTDETVGRVIITWPAASTPPVALPTWGCAFDDPDTGEQMFDVVGLELRIGEPEAGWADKVIEVTLTRLVDTDDNPIGRGGRRLTLTPEYAEWQSRHMADADPGAIFPGQRFRTKAFRYVVAEMRLAASPPGVQPRRVATARIVNDGGDPEVPVPEPAGYALPTTGREITIPDGT